MFCYDQDWKNIGPPSGIRESTCHSFNTLPEKEDHFSGVDKMTGSYDCSVCGVVVPGRKSRLYTISQWNEHKRIESHKKQLECKVQAMSTKLKMKQKYGSATRFDVMQAEQMGDNQMPIDLFFI